MLAAPPKIDGPLQQIKLYFQSISAELDAIESRIAEKPTGNQMLTLVHRLHKLKDEYMQSVELNEQVLAEKNELAGILQDMLMGLMASVQEAKAALSLQHDLHYDNITHNALSAVTDWKLDLEGKR